MATRGGTLFQSVLPAEVASAAYDAANRLTRRVAGGVTTTPTWDAEGQLLSDGLRTYTWNPRGQLTSISGVASFAYDGLGRRRSFVPASTGVQQVPVYDGHDPVQVRYGGGTPTVSNLLAGAGVDERFTRAAPGTGEVSTYLTDALGSTVALADAAGAVRTAYGYDPYGVVQVSGAANDNPFQYTGRENDGTGLYYYRARYYRPDWGRFVSEDPIGLAGGINLYAYAGNNPVQFKDPTGLYADPYGGGMPSGSGDGYGDTASPPTQPSPQGNEGDKVAGRRGRSPDCILSLFGIRALRTTNDCRRRRRRWWSRRNEP